MENILKQKRFVHQEEVHVEGIHRIYYYDIKMYGHYYCTMDLLFTDNS
jgi:hypothetical protein